MDNLYSTSALNAATSVKHDGTWYGVLGYSSKDDVLCLENHTGQDFTIVDASELIELHEIRVEINLQEALDLLFKIG
jgi:hypothetical protein